MIRHLKGRIFELEEMAVAKQGLDKYVSVAVGMHITIEELLGTVFFM